MGVGADGTWEDPLATGAVGGVGRWELEDAADCAIMWRRGFARGREAFSFAFGAGFGLLSAFTVERSKTAGTLATSSGSALADEAPGISPAFFAAFFSRI
jgi:hypothetical protein